MTIEFDSGPTKPLTKMEKLQLGIIVLLFIGLGLLSIWHLG